MDILIGGLVSKDDSFNTNSNKYCTYGALSYVCVDDNIVEPIIVSKDTMMQYGVNNDNGRIEVTFLN